MPVGRVDVGSSAEGHPRQYVSLWAIRCCHCTRGIEGNSASQKSIASRNCARRAGSSGAVRDVRSTTASEAGFPQRHAYSAKVPVGRMCREW